MSKRLIVIILLLVITAKGLIAQKNNSLQLTSPDGRLTIKIEAGAKLQWTVTHQSQIIIAPSAISMHLQGGEIWGDNASIISSKKQKVDNIIGTLHYKKDTIHDKYNALTLVCKGDYGIIFKAYNDGVAYRFFANKKEVITIESEEANFNFSDDYMTYIPYVNDPHNHDIYECSFENNYEHIKLSEIIKVTLAFAPVLIELSNGKKAVITEADLEDYPGMFLQAGSFRNLHGRFAPYVLEDKQGGHNTFRHLLQNVQII